VNRRIEKGKSAPPSQPLTIAEDLTISAGRGPSRPASSPSGHSRSRAPRAATTLTARSPATVSAYMGEGDGRGAQAQGRAPMETLWARRGVELVYDRRAARHGRREVHRRRQPRPREGGVRQAEPGAATRANIYLTIDLDLQRKAEQYFMENEMVGSCVGSTRANGEVLGARVEPSLRPERLLETIHHAGMGRPSSSNPFRIEVNAQSRGSIPGLRLQRSSWRLAGLELGVIDESTTFHCCRKRGVLRRPVPLLEQERPRRGESPSRRSRSL